MVDEIKKNLDEGTTIIVDRYAYSGVAFSAAKVYITYFYYKLNNIFWIIVWILITNHYDIKHHLNLFFALISCDNQMCLYFDTNTRYAMMGG